jgi:membrane protein DedA with SNARE-associated domain/rhodanese-related sulfurtransferase
LKDPFTLVAHYGLAIVFTNVLAEQLGLPIPAVPTLIVSGALAAEGKISGPAVFGAAILACLIADGTWYLAGRRYGLGILRVLCKVSLSPDSCVRQTENRFERWGLFSLAFGKFIPGVSTIAPPLAGAMRIGTARFLFFNVLGSILWTSAAMGLGLVFHREISAVLDRFEQLGTIAVAIVVLLLAAYVGIKGWQRRRFIRAMRLARITVDELRGLMQQGKRPVVVDVRSAAARDVDRRYIPGALAIDLAELDRRRAELPDEREIVFYCTCPNEASAAAAAKQLMSVGYPKVRPLLGGLDEWIAAGYEVEERATR